MRGAQRVAVVGAGISGLASAWLLSQKHQVTLFEAADTLGGHTHTVDVTLDGVCHPVDTGFLVYNTRTYPHLTAMFAHLGVVSVDSEMSFAVSLDEPRLEWAGSSLATLFGQKRNLLRPDFWRMLSDIVRFKRDSVAWIVSHPEDQLSLREFLAMGGYSRPFADWYLLPMAAAIWSCPTQTMLDYPLASFVSFCRNHGLLQVFDRPLWRTVRGGGREYVRKLAAALDDVRLATPVRALQRTAAGLLLHTDSSVEHYDQVVLACHSDQALAILGQAATSAESRLLAAIRYAPNRAVLHTDAALLPRSPALWSAWNYLSSGQESRQGSGHGGEHRELRPVSVSYLINRLQPLPFKTPLMVSLNPQREPVAERVIAEFDYQHPIFDRAAVTAQRGLPAISGAHGVWFCGAWNGYGFHEDGLKSALQVANAMGCRAPWQDADGAAPLLPGAARSAQLVA